MTNTKNGSNQGMVPEARAAMDRFKMEAAAEVGVNLKQGYNCLLYTSTANHEATITRIFPPFSAVLLAYTRKLV